MASLSVASLSLPTPSNPGPIACSLPLVHRPTPGAAIHFRLLTLLACSFATLALLPLPALAEWQADLDSAIEAADALDVELAEARFDTALASAAASSEADFAVPKVQFHHADFYFVASFAPEAHRAEELLVASASGFEAYAGPRTPALAVVLLRLSQAQADAGRRDEAEATFARSREIAAAVLNEEQLLRWTPHLDVSGTDMFFAATRESQQYGAPAVYPLVGASVSEVLAALVDDPEAEYTAVIQKLTVLSLEEEGWREVEESSDGASELDPAGTYAVVATRVCTVYRGGARSRANVTDWYLLPGNQTAAYQNFQFRDQCVMWLGFRAARGELETSEHSLMDWMKAHHRDAPLLRDFYYLKGLEYLEAARIHDAEAMLKAGDERVEVSFGREHSGLRQDRGRTKVSGEKEREANRDLLESGIEKAHSEGAGTSPKE